MKAYLIKRSLPISIFVLAASLVWIWYSRLPLEPTASASIEAPQVGFLAPDFNLSGLDTHQTDLDSLKGSPVILNFWASWCPPCKAEMPAFQEAFEEFSDTGLQIIAINASNQDSLANVTYFVEEHGITLPVLLDQTGSTAKDYLVHSLPTTYFINKDGIITDVIVGGPLPLSLLRIHANQLLSD